MYLAYGVSSGVNGVHSGVRHKGENWEGIGCAGVRSDGAECVRVDDTGPFVARVWAPLVLFGRAARVSSLFGGPADGPIHLDVPRQCCI